MILSQIPGSITQRNVTSFRQDEDQNFFKQNVLRAEHFNRFLIEVRKKNSVTDAQVRQLFGYFDKKSKGYLDFKQFCESIISKECKFFVTNDTFESDNELLKAIQKADSRISRELEFSFARVIEQEIEGMQMLDEARLSLMSQISYCETQRTIAREARIMDVSATSRIRSDSLESDPTQLIQELFRLVDQDDKGFLEIRDLRQFIGSQIGEITFNRTEMILRRFDRNMDGKIDIFEFMYLLTPLASQIRLSETLSMSFSNLIKISQLDDLTQLEAV